jgi:uncharacterized protein
VLSSLGGHVTDIERVFASALGDEVALDALFEPPSGLAARKQTDRLDVATRAFVAASPMLFLATASRYGRCDVTPRGGPPGFVTVLDEHTLAIPDATGNRRIDSYRNVVDSRHAGLLFVIPGRAQTLRVNGRACVSDDAALLERLTAVGKPPRVALVVRADEVFAHCPKAFVRSHLWDPASWPAAQEQPSPAELTREHIADPELSIEQIETSQREALLYRLL